MIDYIISDLHLGHKNIINYCKRPFSTVEEMNKTLINNWNDTVSESETVLFLGDLTLDSESMAKKYLDDLNGEIIFICGNHDRFDMDNDFVNAYESIEFSYKNITFYCTHYPLDIQSQSRVILHGHTHNNDLDNTPFYNSETNAFNFSAELVSYTPVPFSDILGIIENNEISHINTYSSHASKTS